MKKYLFFLFTATPALLLAQQKFDTVTLKNGKSVSGYIYKMDDGKIYVASAADSSVYTANEVQTIMFCHSSRGNCNTTTSTAANNSSSDISNTNSNVNGTVIFKCNQCGSNGNLKINGGTKGSKTTSNYNFNGGNFSEQRECLVPGEYNWSYSDGNGKESTGKFTIQKGEVKEIVLFENK